MATSRRLVLGAAAGGLLLRARAAPAAADAAAPRAPAAGGDRYAGLASARYFEGDLVVETRVDGEKVFTEGPAVDRAGIVYFTNIEAQEILRWDPRAKKLSVFRAPSRHANGLHFDLAGNLLACEGSAGRITRTNMKTGALEIVAAEIDGLPFAPPNDLALDGRGRIYFSSRPAGNTPITMKTNPIGVYRVDPGGKVTRLLGEPDIHMPNGIVTSPDDRTLYLVESHPDAGKNRHIRAYPLAADGSLGEGRTHIDFSPGRSGDGMAIDREGNLYVAAGLHKLRKTSETLDTRPGVHVVSPAGKLVGYAPTPEDTITNCTFGGRDLRTLYVTCGRLLLSARTKIPGKALYRPRR